MKLAHRFIVCATLLVWLHVLLVVLHAISHSVNAIWLSLFGNTFVVVVVMLAPLLALLLLSTRWQRSGALLLMLSMLGALGFGLWGHFLVPGPDNVAQVAPGAWHLPFLLTSILLALLEAAGISIGIWGLYMLPRSQRLQESGSKSGALS